jgi:magnesium-protoporphyrin O-methyltransferase
MPTATYQTRARELETYFDRTAVDAWARLTSDAPVGRIRATVRAGRNQMRQQLLDWLPQDMTGQTLLDAGCGTGALAVEAVRRGAKVVAIDLSPTLVALAAERLPDDIDPTRLQFRSGDMLDPALGTFDHVVCMDALIHYNVHDIAKVLSAWAPRTSRSMLFTFAPRTPALAAMHSVGRFFPSKNRAPTIVPVEEAKLRQTLNATADLRTWRVGESRRIASGFYTSEAMEVRRA